MFGFFDKKTGASRSSLFRPLVSRVKIQKRVSKQGSRESIKLDDEAVYASHVDEAALLPPLSDSHISFCSNFEVISGVPVYVLDMNEIPPHGHHSDLACFLPPSNTRQLGHDTEIRAPLLWALLAKGPASPGTKARKPNFKTAVAAAAFAATIAKGGSFKMKGTRSSKGPQLSAQPQVQFQIKKKFSSSVSLPSCHNSHLSPHEALGVNFFVSSKDPSPVLSYAFSNDGTLMVSGHAGGQLKVWNTENGKLLEYFSCPHHSAVGAVAFRGSTNRRIVSCDIAGSCVMTDIHPDCDVRKEPTRHSLNVQGNEDFSVFAPELSPNGRWLVLRPLNETADIYTRLSHIRGKEVGMPRFPKLTYCVLTAWDLDVEPAPVCYDFRYNTNCWNHSLQIRSLQFSDSCDGFLISTVDEYKDYHGASKTDNLVVVWPDIYDPTNMLLVEGATGTWSPENLVATWDPNTKNKDLKGTCLVWDVRERSRFQSEGGLGVTPAHMTALRDSVEDVVHSCVFIESMKKSDVRLATSLSQSDLRVVIWDVIGSTKIVVLETGVKMSPHSLCATMCGAWLLFYSPFGNKGMMWNLRFGAQVFRMSLPDRLRDPVAPFSIKFAPNCSRFATANAGKIIVWNIGVLLHPEETGTPFLMKSDLDNGTQMRKCKVSCNGDAIAVSLFLSETRMNKVYVWNVRRRVEWILPPWNPTSIRREGITAFALSSCGGQAVACFDEGKLVVWDLTGQPEMGGSDDVMQVTEFDGPPGCLDCCFLENQDDSPHRTVVACISNGYMHWWTTEGAGERSNGGIPGPCVSCTFSVCGMFGSVLSQDMRTVVHWDLAKRVVVKCTTFTVELRQMNKPALGTSWPMAVSPEGSFAIAGLEKDSWKPLKCVPGSSKNDLKRMVGRIPNISKMSSCGRCAVMGDFSDMYESQESPDGWASTVWVVDIEGKMAPKRLEGAAGVPRSIAISGDGRTVVCVSVGSSLTVWSAFGTHGCIPDYHQVIHKMKTKGIPENSQAEADHFDSLLNEFGSSLLNYPDFCQSSMLLHMIRSKKLLAIRTLLQWGRKNNVMVCMHGRGGTYPNALQMAINLRLPDAIQELIKTIMEGGVTEFEIAQIFKESLLDLASVYPTIFYNVIADTRFLRVVGEIHAPEAVFADNSNHFVVATSDGSHPPCDALESFWRKMGPPKMRLAGSIRVPALASVIPYPDVAQLGNNGIIRELLLSQAPLQVYSTAPIRATIAYKWETYARYLLLEELFLYSMILSLFTGYSIMKGHNAIRKDDGWEDGNAVVGLVILMITMVMALCKLYRIARQFYYCLHGCRRNRRQAVIYWASSGLKWLEIISLTLLAFVAPVMHFRAAFEADLLYRQSNRLHQLVAVLSILLWWVLLFYAQAFKHTGPLVIIIQEILKDMRFFLVLALSIMFGFGVAFFVLFNARVDIDDADTLEEFSTLDRAVTTTFGMMLGEFDTSLFYETSHPFVSLILFVAYMMVMMIILLNLLIAIMGDTFDKVTHTKEMQFLKAKAKVIDDVETIIGTSRQNKRSSKIKERLHVLTPNYYQGQRLTRFEWNGRTLALQKNFREGVSEIVKAMDAKLSDWTTEHASSVDRLADSQEQMRREISELRHQNNQLMTTVRQRYQREYSR